MAITVTGRARTDRAARYLKQLSSHLARKLEVEHEGDRATVQFGEATAALTAAEAVLEWTIFGAEAAEAYRLMGIVEGHLLGFGKKEGLAVEWDDAEVEQAYREARRAAEAAGLVRPGGGEH